MSLFLSWLPFESVICSCYYKCAEEDRFKMVRTGQQETMNPIVKDISVVELAKRDARNTAQSLECMESLDLEVWWELLPRLWYTCSLWSSVSLWNRSTFIYIYIKQALNVIISGPMIKAGAEELASL
jgi:hypothetical protein